MTRSPHIIVIGAGLAGLSAADALMSKSARVTLIDKNTGSARGASFANSGMIHTSQSMPWNWSEISKTEYFAASKSVLSLAHISRKILLKRFDELALPDRARPNGCIKLFDNEHTGREFHKLYNQFGIRCQLLRDDKWNFDKFALVFEDDSSADAYLYCLALENALKEAGAAFMYGENNIQLSVQSAAITGVTTSTGNITADHVVVACGNGSPSILSQFDIDLAMYPERGFSLDFNRPDTELPLLPIMHHDSHSALTVFDNHVRLSGTIGQANSKSLKSNWQTVLGDLYDAVGQPIREWTEERPMSRLGRPYICPTVIKGLWVNTGHGHMGWTLSAGSGHLLAEMIFEDEEDTRFNLRQAA